MSTLYATMIAVPTQGFATGMPIDVVVGKAPSPSIKWMTLLKTLMCIHGNQHSLSLLFKPPALHPDLDFLPLPLLPVNSIKGCINHFPQTPWIYKAPPSITLMRNPQSRLISAWFYRGHSPNLGEALPPLYLNS